MKFQPDRVPTQEYSPEQKERIRYLLKLADKDLASPSIVGYHGAGIKALELVIKNGKLFGRPNKSELADSYGIGNKGDLHFYPRASGFPADFDQSYLRYNLGQLSKDQAIQGAMGYAHDNSLRDILVKIVGLDLSNLEHYSACLELSPAGKTMKESIEYVYKRPDICHEVIDIAKKLNLDESAMKKIARAVDKEIPLRKGLIFGLDKKILDEWHIGSGDEGSDLFINCPDGLDIKYLSGLRALGEKEREFLASLRTKI